MNQHEDDAIAAAEEFVQRGFARKRGPEGQVQYQMIERDDFKCPQCGGGWIGIAARECTNCETVLSIWRDSGLLS